MQIRNEFADEAVSRWIAVHSLMASWNQTLSNTTSQWSGELYTLHPSDVLNRFPMKSLQSTIAVEYHTGERSQTQTEILKTNIKDESSAGNRSGTRDDVPSSAKQSTGVIIKTLCMHKQHRQLQFISCCIVRVSCLFVVGNIQLTFFSSFRLRNLL